ncbi:MAG TPA: hypothetical protein VJG90_00875 [Candidatus Nanoarchaeia archaeon]|nr:hypothetical protein [Candidatus Nanoarchaeia archaeon]
MSFTPERDLVGPDLELAEAVEKLVRIRMLKQQKDMSGGKGIFVIGTNLAFLSGADPVQERPHTRSALCDTVLPVTYHRINGGSVEKEKYTTNVPVVVKSVGKITTPLRPTECPALSPSGVVMKLLQDDSIGGASKLPYFRSPFLLLGTDNSQIMEWIEGDTLEKVAAETNKRIQDKLKQGESIDDEVAFLIETLRKAFEMDAELVQHLTRNQEGIPLVDGRGDLVDPGKEKGHLKNLLWGVPTQHAEQGYIPIMLERAKRYGIVSEDQVNELLTLKDKMMDTGGMRSVKRVINQTERRKKGRKRVLPHGDLEPGNIIIGYETSVVGIESALSGFRAGPRVKEYRPIDFGRTRYWNLGKDPVSLFSDSAYRMLWGLPNPDYFGFKGPREEFNIAVGKAIEGVPSEYALDPQSEEEWNASLFLHAASRSAKRMCRLKNEGLDGSLDEMIQRADNQEIGKRLRLTQSTQDYFTFFLGACEQLGICGAYKGQFAKVFEKLQKVDLETIRRLSEVYQEGQ